MGPGCWLGETMHCIVSVAMHCIVSVAMHCIVSVSLELATMGDRDLAGQAWNGPSRAVSAPLPMPPAQLAICWLPPCCACVHDTQHAQCGCLSPQ